MSNDEQVEEINMWINNCEIAKATPERLINAWKDTGLKVSKYDIVVGSSPYIFSCGHISGLVHYCIVVQTEDNFKNLNIGDYVEINNKDDLGRLEIKNDPTLRFFVTNLSNIRKFIPREG